MFQKICLFVLLLLISVALRTYATDSSLVIITSPRVGAVIDKNEREYYRVFMSIQNFVSASFIYFPDSGFYARINYQKIDGTMADVLIQFSQPALFRFAERINHFEELVKGEYQMGRDTVILQFVGGKEITSDSVMKRALPMEKSLWSVDSLPFNRNVIIKTEPRFPQWYFEIAISTYSPNFSSLNEPYDAIEKSFRETGASIPHKDPKFMMSPLIWFSLKVQILPKSALLFETAKNIAGTDAFTAVSFSYLYYPDVFHSTTIYPYLSGGIGRYYFSGSVRYDALLDDNYHYLDEVRSKGGAYGVTMLAGIEVRSQSGVGAGIFINYLLMETIETTVSSGASANVNFSSTLAGLKIGFSL